METLGDLGIIPTEYVDISAVEEIKLEALSCHASQVGWLFEHDGVGTLGNTRTADAYRGNQCGVPAAEGFAQACAICGFERDGCCPEWSCSHTS